VQAPGVRAGPSGGHRSTAHASDIPHIGGWSPRKASPPLTCTDASRAHAAGMQSGSSPNATGSEAYVGGGGAQAEHAVCSNVDTASLCTSDRGPRVSRCVSSDSRAGGPRMLRDRAGADTGSDTKRGDHAGDERIGPCVSSQ